MVEVYITHMYMAVKGYICLLIIDLDVRRVIHMYMAVKVHMYASRPRELVCLLIIDLLGIHIWVLG